MTIDDNSGVLRETLANLRVSGSIFLRAEYTDPWAYRSVDGPTTAAMLMPSAERLVLFHLVASGRCWISLPAGEKHWAEAGDVIVIPYGDQHLMGGESVSDIVDLRTFLTPPPWSEMPVLRHGSGGARTDVICGYLHSEDLLLDPRMRAFPDIFVVHPPAGPAAQWVSASIDFALAASAGLRTDPVAARLPELLLTEVLGIHLATTPAAGGWLAALHDPIVGPAMAKLHADPRRRWTVADLASECAVSRSLLDSRFRKILKRAPIRYLTEWRLHLAEVLLADTTDPVSKIAHAVGYDSDEGFSRSFKRTRGVSPSAWRSAHSPTLPV
ncbi:AraC family transcriptional regulator [Aldersonia kunmingensis]|uniref:AraC family transcriptional regulator n=1 Tax=Aldersonia kunmingensis TaxID=408066 RepID=UPI00083587CF|nr:AraC family transcriptional regulator [Aldersonia kunmingensis]